MSEPTLEPSSSPSNLATGVLAHLKSLFRAVEAIGRAINRVVGRVLVFLVYFLAIGPLAGILRLSGKSVLEPVPPAPSGSLWLPRPAHEEDPLKQARRQF